MLRKLKYNIKHPVKYLKEFIGNEDGVEMIEIAVGVAIAAALISINLAIKDKAETGMNKASSKLDEAFNFD